MSLVDQQTCALDSSPGFRRCVTFDVDKRSYERYLEPNLLATQLGRGRQARDLAQSTGKLSHGFNKRRVFKGSLCGFVPPFYRRFGKARLCEVMC